ncbi:MAG: hypothetical protein IJ308_08270 [Clostridia bacterium]|nr:hypothetical protein [Clostridia bacterium]MBQ7913713.1 hypothetical protein [Clostridia bacterium]
MENYAKVMLYVYPFLKTVQKDYEGHIRNRAILSHGSGMTAERLAEYIASEIIVKRSLEGLKEDLEKVFGRLQERENRLLSFRYFGKRKQLREFLKNESAKSGWSERKYFREQKRLGEKVSAMMRSVGLTEERYEAEFAHLDIFRRIARFVAEGRDEKVCLEEGRLACAAK